MWLCKTRPSKLLSTRNCGYLIILPFVAAQSDVKFQYEKFSMPDEEEGLRYIKVILSTIISCFVIFLSSIESLFIHDVGFVRIFYSNISLD